MKLNDIIKEMEDDLSRRFPTEQEEAVIIHYLPKLKAINEEWIKEKDEFARGRSIGFKKWCDNEGRLHSFKDETMLYNLYLEYLNNKQ